MKQFFLLFLMFSLLAGCGRPKGFTLCKISSSYGGYPGREVESDPFSHDLATLLKGPYTYIGNKNHTYAFLSADEKTVIKFFKQKHMRIQAPFLSSETKPRRTKKRHESFSNYLVAYKKLRPETGLLYLRLSPTRHLHQTIALIDQQGKEHPVNLDETEFLIQKKANLSSDHLSQFFSERAYSICSLLHLVATRSRMGIYDKDIPFYKNFGFFGFIDNQAIRINIGKFRVGQEVRPIREKLQELFFQAKGFLQESSPEFTAIANFVIDKEVESYQ